MLNEIPSSSERTGQRLPNLVLMPTAKESSPAQETPSANPLTNLKSKVSASELLALPPAEPRLLQVSKEDIDALSQVIHDFKCQLIQAT